MWPYRRCTALRRAAARSRAGRSTKQVCVQQEALGSWACCDVKRCGHAFIRVFGPFHLHALLRLPHTFERLAGKCVGVCWVVKTHH
jgi:hypothetical protein